MTEPTKVMTPAAQGFTYDQYRAQGWTDEQLVANGLMEPRHEGAHDPDGDERLRLLLERIDRLEGEKKGIADDIRDVYAEAKAVGYDTKVMREIRKLQKMRPDDRAEFEMLRDTYKAATGMG